jgi:hypothetical protein
MMIWINAVFAAGATIVAVANTVRDLRSGIPWHVLDFNK